MISIFQMCRFRPTSVSHCFFSLLSFCRLQLITIFFAIPALSFHSGLTKSKCTAHQRRITRNGADSHPTTMEWKPLDPESLVSAKCLIEQTLCVSSETHPQLAKDFQYANAVLDAWKAHEAEADEPWRAEYSPITYAAESDEQKTKLHGYLVRQKPEQMHGPNQVVLFFHTAAGPQDIFLLYKAAALVNSMNVVVMIADLFSDDTGWGWDQDRSRYEAVRNAILLETNSGRLQLQERLHAAIDAAHSLVEVKTMAALGWCFGGHAILELARMRIPSIRAMVTFHGVFSGAKAPLEDDESRVQHSPCQVLICNGSSDPFVSDESLETALRIFQYHRNIVSLLTLKHAKHGFSNPAQEFNSNPAFGYAAEAANKSWNQALGLLRRSLS